MQYLVTTLTGWLAAILRASPRPGQSIENSPLMASAEANGGPADAAPELLVLLDREVHDGSAGGDWRPANLVLGDEALVVEEVEGGASSLQALCATCLGRTVGAGHRIPYAQVLDCTFEPCPSGEDPGVLAISALSSTNANSARVIKLRGRLQGAQDASKAQAWADAAMRKAYKDVKPYRRLRILLNPQGGPGHALKLWSGKVQSILQAAGCQVDMTVTERRLHAVEIGRTIQIERYDAVVCMSGDGTIHELINGFGKRSDAGRALRSVSIGAIPAGSANGLVVNIQGPSDSHNTVLATLNVIKGRPVPLDLCSVTQRSPDGETVDRSLSFMSLAFGLMADVDIGTEHLRWMGGTRFIIGYLQGAVRNRKQRCRLEIDVVEADKDRIHRDWLDRWSAIADGDGDGPAEGEEGLPRLVSGDVTADLSSRGWTTFDQDVTTIYAGTLPYVAAELMQFPVKLAGDGSVDIIVHECPSVGRAFAAMDGVEKGKAFRNPDVKYFKARAFRLTPLPSKEKKTFVAVDGEDFPYTAVQYEVHAGLASVLSMQPSLGHIGRPDDL